MRRDIIFLAIFIVFLFPLNALSINFIEVASWDGIGIRWYTQPFRAYDSDHDGNQELFLDPLKGNSLIFEHKGNNLYDTTRTAHYFLFDFDIGDLDGDGFTDAVACTSTGSDEWIRIYESPDYNSFPTAPFVWGYDDPNYDEANWFTITNDLDQDGKNEFLWHYLAVIHIFECNGDNSYQEVWTTSDSGNYSKVQCGDFDCDGKRDFMATSMTGSYRGIGVFENTSVGVDSYIKVWETTYGDTMCYYNSYMTAQAKDMDGDGKPEFIVGSQRPGGDDSVEFAAFETNGDNSYHKVWRICPEIGGSGGISTGDVDGDGKEEMVFSTRASFGIGKEGIFVYKNNGPDSYQLIWQKTKTGLDGAAPLVYDLNSNGYGEIIYSGYKDYAESTHTETHILEIVGETNFVSLSADSGDKFVLLNWTTAREIANTAWWIERSIKPDTDFVRLATIADTQGTRYDTTNYTYIETTVTNGITYYYRVADVPLNGAPVWHGPVSATPYLTGVEELQSSKFKVQSPNLMQNYPNPFSQNTDIRYQIADDSKVSLKIYNVAGQLVRTLIAYEPKSPGAYKVTWDGKDESGKAVSNGVYFYHLIAGSFTASKKMIVVR